MNQIIAFPLIFTLAIALTTYFGRQKEALSNRFKKEREEKLEVKRRERADRDAEHRQDMAASRVWRMKISAYRMAIEQCAGMAGKDFYFDQSDNNINVVRVELDGTYTPCWVTYDTETKDGSLQVQRLESIDGSFVIEGVKPKVLKEDQIVNALLGRLNNTQSVRGYAEAVFETVEKEETSGFSLPIALGTTCKKLREQYPDEVYKAYWEKALTDYFAGMNVIANEDEEFVFTVSYEEDIEAYLDADELDF